MQATEPSLNKINNRIRQVLQLLAVQQPSKIKTVSEELVVLSQELKQTSAQMQIVLSGKSASAQPKDVDDYRANLEQLQRALCQLQPRLLTERARLDRELVHLKAANGWASARKMTTQRRPLRPRRVQARST